MRDAFRTVAAFWSALPTRRDLLLEILALRHQLGVLARSDRRFRPADRLLWLCLQWCWPRWTDALVLVQPVARWRRKGFWECCRPRSRRRLGRPRIAADIRALIRCMTRENRLWGAPRIHGELLKLGITVSERTVSRYLPDRTRRPSQTWRTFLANHFRDLTLPSSLASSGGRGVGDIVDTRVRPLPSNPMSVDAPRASEPWAVGDCSPSVPRMCWGWPDPRADLHHRTSTRPSSGRDPPASGAYATGPHACERRFLRPDTSICRKADGPSEMVSLGADRNRHTQFRSCCVRSGR
jgi:hypothetical protein